MTVPHKSSAKPLRLVLTTFGSLGDLHPYIAIALEWQARGHIAVIATSEAYRAKVEGEGILFAPVHPDMPSPAESGPLMSKVMNLSQGPRYLIRDLILPGIRDSYRDLLAACDGADAIVSHPLTFAVPFVARQRNIPWVYIALSPAVFLSAYDFPYATPFPALKKIRFPSPRLYSLAIGLIKLVTSGWFKELRNLSKELGFYPLYEDAVGNGKYSPHLNVALFSSCFASPQPDWPDNVVVAGFPYYDKPSQSVGLSPELLDFLESGEEPVVFTLGSAAVMTAGSFYDESAQAAIKLGRRAVLLIGGDPANRPPVWLPDSIFVTEYASFSALFPRAAAIVHQGGIGTTAQAMRAGKPMLIVPFAFDQPDNGRRVTRMRIGKVVSRSSYNSSAATQHLKELLDSGYATRAAAIGRLIRMENGAASACNRIESKLIEESM